MQKGNPIARVLRFAKRKSFYIVLGLCAVAIAVSGYILFFTGGEEQPDPVLSGRETPQDRQQVSGSASNVTVPAPEQKTPEQPEPAPQQPAKTADTPADQPPAQTTVSQPGAGTPETKETRETGAAAQIKAPVFTFPVRGAEVQREYSGAQLVFDETMGDWRTHNGTDFACDEGDEVMAVLDGVVERIYEDGLLGACVVLDHGADLKSLYCGLTVAEGLREDQKLSAGQTLGRACGSILGESAQACHVHLELRESGQLIDPMSVLK